MFIDNFLLFMQVLVLLTFFVFMYFIFKILKRLLDE